MGIGPSKKVGPHARELMKAPHPDEYSEDDVEVATFALGCFWGAELLFSRLPGVIRTEVGYTNGQVETPTYEAVCTGKTGHAEAVRIEYDGSSIGFDDLVDVFFESHNPTTLNRQGHDRGTQYRSGIYYHSEEQEEVARRKASEVAEALGKTVVTEIAEAGTWYPAEDYHQQYLEKGGQCARKGDTTSIKCYG